MAWKVYIVKEDGGLSPHWEAPSREGARKAARGVKAEAAPRKVRTKIERVPEVDLMVDYQGSITQFQPLTRAGREWFEDNVSVPPYARLGAAVCVESRYAPPIVEGAREAGIRLGGVS